MRFASTGSMPAGQMLYSLYAFYLLYALILAFRSMKEGNFMVSSSYSSRAAHPAGAHHAAQRRRRRRRRIAGVVVALVVSLGLVTLLLSLWRGKALAGGHTGNGGSGPNSGSAAALPASSEAADSSASSSNPANSASSTASSEPAGSDTTATGAVDPALGLTPAEAAAILADPLMVLVNHTNAMPEDYTFETGKCGSATSVNNTLQAAACDAFLQMQAAAAADGVTVWMQSGYRSVEYQTNLYNKKTQYYLDQGYDEATAREKAANIVMPPRYSEHNCGLAADLNSPEHTSLDEGFESTQAFTWLCENAATYGFILRYPKGDAEAVTEITYEPWHWRYVGAENAARYNASGMLCFEDYIAALQALAAKA
jgi:D-alanyl-D-alanine carboxypeptidase